MADSQPKYSAYQLQVKRKHDVFGKKPIPTPLIIQIETIIQLILLLLNHGMREFKI
ncbi:MAG: hypothetical protein V7K25_00605 [Nostoc sp.]|uniref:hypothetical protein n=1 Tax=Nostoc sp. TaxID=1180 RepID=UPI002FF6FCD8